MPLDAPELHKDTVAKAPTFAPMAACCSCKRPLPRAYGGLSLRQSAVPRPGPRHVTKTDAPTPAQSATCRARRALPARTKCHLSRMQKALGSLVPLRNTTFEPKFDAATTAHVRCTSHSLEVDVRKYRSNADSPTRIDFGIELIAGLTFFSETKGYVASFQQLNDELDAAHTTRRAARKPLLEKRAAFRFAHHNADQTIRMVHRAAEIADGGRRGPLSEAIFPDGLGPVVAPFGTRQIKPTEALIDRLTRCKLPAADAFRTEWKPKLDAALTALSTTAKDLQSARDAYLDAFKAEVALRDEHYLAIDKLMGLVRAAFPRDRARQDLVFPVLDTNGESSNDGGEGNGEAPGGEAGETGGVPT